jgi:hypothetical protein
MATLRSGRFLAAVVMLTGCTQPGEIQGNTVADGGVDARAPADGTPAIDAAGPADAADAGSTVAQLIALTSSCAVASNGRYALDSGATPTVDICRLNGAFFWKADMDIDCDGKTTAQCNLQADPSYQDQTSFDDSMGNPLDAANLPYVVVPLPSSRFDYQTENIKPGALVIVIYNGQMTFGVFGDEGPSDIIGEASYAMAVSLGIDPDPSTGGIDRGVTYIIFTGTAAEVHPIEDHQAAITLGQTLVTQLLQDN